MSVDPQSMLPYCKPWLPLDRQVGLLKERGLLIRDEPGAETFLSHFNYYRFSGYALPFQHVDACGGRAFNPGARFEDVMAVYFFDRSLRDLFGEASEIIELDIRTSIAYLFGQTHGAFGHTRPENFMQGFRGKNKACDTAEPVFSHGQWLGRARSEAMRSTDRFIEHYRKTYRDFPNLPIWMLTEICSFGTLSQMFSGMIQKDQTRIANRYGLQAKDCVAMLHHLVYIRNICAHHSRLWDKRIRIESSIPPGRKWDPIRLLRQDAYTSLVIHKWMLKGCKIDAAIVDQWCGRVNTCLAETSGKYPAIFKPYSEAALAANPIWNAPCGALRAKRK